jgi:ATP-dependent protease ClpP protease subunit
MSKVKSKHKLRESYKTTDEDLYGENFFHIYLYTIFDAEMSISISERINAMNNDKKYKRIGIVIHINSPGGCVASAMGIVNTIKSSTLPVIALIEGACISAATFICVVCHYRVMLNNTQFLIHQLSYGVSGNHDEIEIEVQRSSTIVEMIKNLFRDNTKLSDEYIDKLMGSEILLQPNECLKNKIIDHIFISQKQRTITKPRELHTYKYHNLYMYTFGREPDIYTPSANIVYAIIHGTDTILLRFGATAHIYMLNVELRRMLPIVNTIINIPRPVYALIDGTIASEDLIIFLVSDVRYINKDVTILINFVNLIARFPAKSLTDLNSNTELFKRFVSNILEKYTKLPTVIKKNIFTNRYMINSADALKYGMVDVILN